MTVESERRRILALIEARVKDGYSAQQVVEYLRGVVEFNKEGGSR